MRRREEGGRFVLVLLLLVLLPTREEKMQTMARLPCSCTGVGSVYWGGISGSVGAARRRGLVAAAAAALALARATTTFYRLSMLPRSHIPTHVTKDCYNQV